MTKAEVRAVVLSKMRLGPGQVVIDIGAGTGSVSVEAALLCPSGRVYAVERDPEGVRLIRQNAARFDATNLEVVAGQAPEALEGLPEADRIVTGGHGGHLEAILRACQLRLRPGGRLVVISVTLETAPRAISWFDQQGLESEVATVSVARAEKAGSSRIWKAQNPVTIISAEVPR